MPISFYQGEKLLKMLVTISQSPGQYSWKHIIVFIVSFLVIWIILWECEQDVMLTQPWEVATLLPRHWFHTCHLVSLLSVVHRCIFLFDHLINYSTDPYDTYSQIQTIEINQTGLMEQIWHYIEKHWKSTSYIRLILVIRQINMKWIKEKKNEISCKRNQYSI